MQHRAEVIEGRHDLDSCDFRQPACPDRWVPAGDDEPDVGQGSPDSRHGGQAEARQGLHARSTIKLANDGHRPGRGKPREWDEILLIHTVGDDGDGDIGDAGSQDARGLRACRDAADGTPGPSRLCQPKADGFGPAEVGRREGAGGGSLSPPLGVDLAKVGHHGNAGVELDGVLHHARGGHIDQVPRRRVETVGESGAKGL